MIFKHCWHCRQIFFTWNPRWACNLDYRCKGHKIHHEIGCKIGMMKCIRLRIVQVTMYLAVFSCSSCIVAILWSHYSLINTFLTCACVLQDEGSKRNVRRTMNVKNTFLVVVNSLLRSILAFAVDFAFWAAHLGLGYWLGQLKNGFSWWQNDQDDDDLRNETRKNFLNFFAFCL